MKHVLKDTLFVIHDLGESPNSSKNFQIFELALTDSGIDFKHTNRKSEEVSLFNVLKKTLRKEFGQVKYEQYAMSIKKNIREAKTDNSEIFNDLYEMLQHRDQKHLEEMQERLNTSLLDAFYVSKNYLWAFIAYLAAFVIIASYVIQMYSVPLLLFISTMFLVKTYEFLVNKFCYVDAHLVLIYKAVLDKIRAERKMTARQDG